MTDAAGAASARDGQIADHGCATGLIEISGTASQCRIGATNHQDGGSQGDISRAAEIECSGGSVIGPENDAPGRGNSAGQGAATQVIGSGCSSAGGGACTIADDQLGVAGQCQGSASLIQNPACGRIAGSDCDRPDGIGAVG